MQYDANGWLSKLSQYDSANALVSEAMYTRDRVGNILTQTNTAGANTGTITYTYDALYRLKTADYPAIGTGSASANDESYTYDKVGNRQTATQGSLTLNENSRYYNYTPGTNRLLEIRIGSATGALESSFSYDFEGNLTNQTGSNPKTFVWDAKGRLKTLTKSGVTETYGYDPMDYRIRHSNTANGQLDYFLEGEHLESVEQGGETLEKYFRGASTDELIAAYLKGTDGKTKPYQYHHDQLTSTTQVTAHNGGTLQSTTYSAFGAIQSQTGSSPNRLKYTGREDDGTGLYYYRARYYDPSTGRFISEDPLGFEAGINFYAYVDNNPINANDPTGMCPSCVGAATSVLLGGAIRYATSGGDLNSVFDSKAIGLDAGLGAVGAGLVNKFSTINQLSKINSLPVPGRALGSLGESLAGISSKGKAAIESLSNTAVRRFPDLNLGNITEVKNVARISSRDAAQIYDSILFDQARGATTTLLTRGSATNISLVQNFVDSGLLNVAKIPGINSSGVANISTGTSALIGSAFGSINFLSGPANGGFLLYPNKPNNNQMQSVYNK